MMCYLPDASEGRGIVWDPVPVFHSDCPIERAFPFEKIGDFLMFFVNVIFPISPIICHKIA